MDRDSHSNSPKPGEINSFWVLGARLTWTLVGPAVLVAVIYGIVTGGTGWLTGYDAAFGIIIGLMLLGRWTEQRSGSATTLTGEPASPQQLKRYVAVLIPVTAAVWIAANVLGNHVLD